MADLFPEISLEIPRELKTETSFLNDTLDGSNGTITLNGSNGTITLDSPLSRELKVDKRILECMQRGGEKRNGETITPSAAEFFGPLQQMGVEIDLSSTFRDRQGNEIPIVKVSSTNNESLEYACAKIMQSLDPHRDKMTFNIDVPSSDHSFIIGKDGVRIKQLSRDTHCHIHLPDCNKAMGKKSNKISIAGTTFNSIERARDSIRKNLPLNIQFCLNLDSNKISLLDSSSSEIQSIKRRHMVDVNFFGLANIVGMHNAHSGTVTCAVKGNRSQLTAITEAVHEIFKLAYGLDYFGEALDFEISIDISAIHHQYVRGKNNCNLKVIHQRIGAEIIFPSDKSNVVRIRSRNIQLVVMGWQEIMGYLPLMLSFDLNMEEHLIRDFAMFLEKKHGISIRYREKLPGTIFTLFIKTQERHSLCLNEIREQFLEQKKSAPTRSFPGNTGNPSFLQTNLPVSSPSIYPTSDQTINTYLFPVEDIQIPAPNPIEPRIISPPRVLTPNPRPMFGSNVWSFDGQNFLSKPVDDYQLPTPLRSVSALIESHVNTPPRMLTPARHRFAPTSWPYDLSQGFFSEHVDSPARRHNTHNNRILFEGL